METPNNPFTDTFKPGDLVEVAVTLPLWQTLTYRVPEGLAAAARRVCLSWCRWAGAGWWVIYWVQGASSPGIVIKDIAALLDPAPRFAPELIPFYRWLAQYYQHPIGEVFKTVIPDPPAGKKAGLERWISLPPGEAPATGRLGPKALSVLDFLEKNGSCPLSELALQDIPRPQDVVRRLAHAGFRLPGGTAPAF